LFNLFNNRFMNHLTAVIYNWSWVIEISKRFFGKAQTLARVNSMVRS
jgi:hypothetical protein